MLHKNQLVVMASLVATATLALTARADLITFDDIPSGRIGDQYLSRGVRFFVGNGEFGTSTGFLMQNGAPLTANAGPNWTAVSWPNIMNPGAEAGVPGNSDIIVHFFDASGARTLANSVGIVNDMDGNPSTIFIEGFDLNGISLGRTQINGLGSGGTFSNPAIYSASIYAASGQAGLIGVDNFSFTLVPAPGTATLLGILCCSMGRRSRRAVR
jgi:hypothetical protein